MQGRQNSRFLRKGVRAKLLRGIFRALLSCLACREAFDRAFISHFLRPVARNHSEKAG